MSYYIKVGSITNAQRARSFLHSASVKAQIRKLPNPKPGDGCGYVLLVDEQDLQRSLSRLERAGIRVLGAQKYDLS